MQSIDFAYITHSDKNIYQNACILEKILPECLARGEKLPDYVVFHKNEKIIFEIGGAGKKRKQLKGISGSRFVLSQPGNLEKGIPLILRGFLW